MPIENPVAEVTRTQAQKDVAVFKKELDRVVVNEHGAYVPKAIFGTRAEITSDITRLSDGGVRVTLTSMQGSHEHSGVASHEPNRSREMRWLAEHRKEYAGQWVVVEGDTLVAHGADAQEVFRQVREAGMTRPFLAHVESSEDLPFGGW
jgi:hypothetical protein